ncbi:hypothetical protein Hdeb2414_s0006g00220081 [Helianthus debilis subsp. tardiflorus]
MWLTTYNSSNLSVYLPSKPRTIGTHGACTGGAIVVGTWTIEFHVKHLHFTNLLLMLGFTRLCFR